MRTWLRDQRVRKGLTLKEMGHELGISESYYCAIENGERQQKMDLVLAAGISSVLNIPISEIVSLENSRLRE